ncbi:MAG: c-type cytochrome [Chromatiales bacterium]|jgi:cytochrome c5
MFKRTLAMTLVGANLAFSGLVMAEEDRSAVLERIKPVGTVSIVGQEQPAAAAPAEAAAAPAVEAPAPAAPAMAEAAPAAAPAAAADGKAIYSTACFACHGTGAAGAPKLGDQAAWAPRVSLGKDALLQSAINGKGAMPPKGGRTDLSDAEISAAIDYMLDQL